MNVKMIVLLRILAAVSLVGFSPLSLPAPGLKAERQVTPAGSAGAAAERRGIDFPLKLASNKRHLVDQKGSPILVNGDSAWYLLNGATLESLKHYLDVRKRQGFNALLMQVTDALRPANMYGEVPYQAPGDFSRPNDAYFDRVEQYLSIIQREGFIAIMNPAYLGYGSGSDGYYREIVHAGPAKMKAYGRYIGSRFSKFKNIIWFMGGDTPPASALAEVRAVAEGIKEMDSTNVLFTTHNAREQSGILFYEGENWLNINSTYAHCGTAARQNAENYKRTPPLPFLFFEGTYETADSLSSNERCVRSQAYQTVLQGGMGHFMGNWAVYFFDIQGGWRPHLHSNGGRTLGFFRKLMESRSWHTLQPDTANSLVPADHGSLTDDSGSYMAAAISPTADSAMIYFPGAKAVAVQLKALPGASQVAAWWYYPATGQATRIGNFPTSGVQRFVATSEAVLILDDASKDLPPPGRNE